MEDVKFGFVAKDIISEGRVSEEDVALIKNFVNTQKLPNLTDEQLIVFLLSCGKDQEATRNTILGYYSIKKKNPEIFDNRDMDRDDLQLQLRTLNICILPKRTEDGCVILYQKLKDTNYANYEMGPAFKLFVMNLDTAIYDGPPTGLVILFDMKGYGLMHFAKTKLNLAKSFIEYLQEAMPIRLKCIHFLNSVYFIDKLLFLFKPFMKEELLNSFYFHSSNINMEDFYTNCISRECLPEEYGGNLPSIDVLQEESAKKCSDFKNFFIAEEEQRKNCS